ncbi:MAG: preprotein translocase subunit SecG [Christensenellaceae bacterium]
MEILSLVIKIILVVFSIFLIAIVLLQSGAKTGVPGAIGGGAEQMWGKKKARGMDALLIRLTKVAAIGFMVLALLLVIMQKYWM